MITRTITQSVYYPVSEKRADAIRGSGRIRYVRSLFVVMRDCPTKVNCSSHNHQRTGAYGLDY